MKTTVLQKIVMCLITLLAFADGKAQVDSLLENLTLKDLLNVKVVTATKLSQGLEQAPATVLVITREQIRVRGYQSLLDVMQDLPDVKIDDKVYSGIRNNVTIRGIQGSDKFIILLDGVNISSPSSEAMPIMENYPVHLAEQIEVVYGPSSALYGANAVSAVINIITKKLLRKDFSADVSSAGDVYGYSNTTLYMAKKLSEKASFVISGQYFYDRGVDYSKLYKDDSQLDISSHRTGTFNTIYGPMTPAEPVRAKYEAPMQAYNLYGAFQMDNFTFSYFRNSFRLPSAFGNNTSNALYNKEVFIDQSVTSAAASYKMTADKLSSATSLVISHYDLAPESNYRNLYSSMASAYKYSTNTMFRIDQQLDYRLNKKVNISVGAAYEDYNAVPQTADLSAPVDLNSPLRGSYLGSDAYYRPQGLEAQFYYIKYYNVGSYLQTEISSGDKFSFTIGSRYDFNSRYGSTINPRLGLVHHPSSKTTLKLMFGSAYRAPAPSNSYAQWGSFVTADSGKSYQSYFLHLPNPDLKPITSVNTEISLKHQITSDLAVSLNAYYSLMKGLYQFSDDNLTTRLYNNSFNGIPVDYIEVFTNNNRQKTWGGSLLLNWKYNVAKLRLNSYASLSYVNGLIEDGMHEKVQMIPDKELDFISHFMIRIGTDGKWGKFSLAPRITIMSPQHITGIADTTGSVHRRQTIPGYALLNVSLRYHAAKKLSVFANISNALNQRYRAVSFNMDLNNTNTDLFYGQPQDPIRVMGGFSLQF